MAGHARLPHARPVRGQNLELQLGQQGRIIGQLQARRAEAVMKYCRSVRGVAVAREVQQVAIGEASGKRRRMAARGVSSLGGVHG